MMHDALQTDAQTEELFRSRHALIGFLHIYIQNQISIMLPKKAHSYSRQMIANIKVQLIMDHC